MDEQDRSELERLKRQVESARRDLDHVWMQVQQLEARLRLEAQRSESFSATKAEPMEIAPAPLSPAEMPDAPPQIGPLIGQVPEAAPRPPLIPPVIPPQPTPAFTQPATQPQSIPRAHGAPAEPPPVVSSEPPPVYPTPEAQPAAGGSSFEMRLGTYWLVRIGIVMLLTALVFFGRWAYQNVIASMGAIGKVTLMYLSGAALLGIGGWLQRKQESLRNYGQVLFAGGLAAVYFTTYAAHHVANLRVIESALLDGLLLLGWAGFMAFLADRKKSELLSLFAIGLAYYTSVITNIGLFTLYSNLVLTAAAIFFLVRHRWAALSFLSLVATYFAFAYWRYFHDGTWLWTDRETALANFWPGNLFLFGYWILFTAAAFLSRHEKLSGANRAAFVTTNNAAFFLLVTLSLTRTYRDSFWMFALGYGAVLLVLALASKRTHATEAVVAGNYLTQGLLLITIGLIAKFSGLQLALLLASESVILLILGLQQKNLILRVGSFVTAALAVGWCIDGMKRFDPPGLYLGAGIGLLLAFNAWWSRRNDEAPDEGLLRPRTTCFAALALLTWLVTTWNNTSAANFPLVLAVETLVLTASIYAIRIRELSLLAQGFLMLAQVLWLFRHMESEVPVPLWNPVVLISITLALAHWWQRQNIVKIESPGGSQAMQVIYSLAAVGVTFAWLHPEFAPETWLALTSLLAVGLTVYAALTRFWFLAAAGQLFIVASGWEFLAQLAQGHPRWTLPLAPIAALIALSAATVIWFKQREDDGSDLRKSLLGLAVGYRWVALVMSLAWVHEYIPARERFWVFALLGAAIFCWAGWRKSQEGLVVSAVFTVTGFCGFWFPWHGASTVYVPNLLAILLLPGQQQLARRAAGHFDFQPEIQAAMIALGGLSLWLFVSRWVSQESSGFYLTVSWAVLAFLLFVAGLGLRERMYRWLGLAVLGCALGRVILFDVWKLHTIYRIASFFALGVVLLVLGFIYNKYQEKIKEWL
ncbi:MAG TPA: DUF2339 domain-containing protein [Verrucomicrobiae bacterium]|nr:DUF2339 domain-containing protein [Verrucomicrobiae bacterium]